MADATPSNKTAKIERPLSPHIQIYNMFAITSLTSILHRITGAALVVGSLIVVWWLMAVVHGQESYDCFYNAMHSCLGQLILLGFTWAFWYQLINGCRHLLWDTGVGFKIKTARLTGKLILFGSILVALATWCYIRSL